MNKTLEFEPDRAPVYFEIEKEIKRKPRRRLLRWAWISNQASDEASQSRDIRLQN